MEEVCQIWQHLHIQLASDVTHMTSACRSHSQYPRALTFAVRSGMLPTRVGVSGDITPHEAGALAEAVHSVEGQRGTLTGLQTQPFAT